MGCLYNYKYTVQFRDTDAAGVVYFANIISICHVAYEASLIEAGIDLKSFVSNSDFAIPLIQVSADFFKPLFCGDRVVIQLNPKAIDSSRFEIDYQILEDLPTSNHQQIATVKTKHVSIDPVSRKRIDLPELINNWLNKWSIL
jgi:1,4-dihydroxy-2-naphthoyl-CoA hydrolase